ncbi:MAG: hypothetical protein AB7O24_29040 [Kofleriaceae bacterium]
MSSRQIGAVLALVAAVLLAASIVLPWWNGHPVVNGRARDTQIVKVAPLGGKGCNKNGRCSSFELADGSKYTSYAALGTSGVLAVVAALFAIGAFTNREWRNSLYGVVLGGAAVATVAAIAMIAIGPTPQSDQQVAMPSLGGDDGYLAFGVFAFGAAIVAAVAGAVLGVRSEDPIRLASAGARLTPEPSSEYYPVPAVTPDDRASLAVSEPPQPHAPLPVPAPSPAGNLPGPAGPLGYGQAPAGPIGGQLRPLYDAPPQHGGGGGFPRQRPPTVPVATAPPAPVAPPVQAPPPAHAPVVANRVPGVPPPAGGRSMPDAPTLFGTRDALAAGPPPAKPAAVTPGTASPAESPAPPPPVRSTPQADALIAAAARAAQRPRPLTGPPPAQIIPGAPAPRARPSEQPPSVTAPTARQRPVSAPPPGSIIPAFAPLPRGKPMTQPPGTSTIASRAVPPPSAPAPSPAPAIPVVPGLPRADTDQDDRATVERDQLREQAFDAARTMFRPPTTATPGGGATTDRDEAATTRASNRETMEPLITRPEEPRTEESLTMRAVPSPAKDKPSGQKLPLPAPDVTDQNQAITLAGVTSPQPSMKPSSPPKVISTAPESLPPPAADQPASSANPSPACPQCEAPMAWVEQHLRFFCKSCRMYF